MILTDKDEDVDDADADDNEKNQYNFNSFVNCRHLNLDHHPVSTIDIVNYQYYQNQQQLNHVGINSNGNGSTNHLNQDNIDLTINNLHNNNNNNRE